MQNAMQIYNSNGPLVPASIYYDPIKIIVANASSNSGFFPWKSAYAINENVAAAQQEAVSLFNQAEVYKVQAGCVAECKAADYKASVYEFQHKAWSAVEIGRAAIEGAAQLFEAQVTITQRVRAAEQTESDRINAMEAGADRQHDEQSLQSLKTFFANACSFAQQNYLARVRS